MSAMIAGQWTHDYASPPGCDGIEWVACELCDEDGFVGASEDNPGEVCPHCKGKAGFVVRDGIVLWCSTEREFERYMDEDNRVNPGDWV